METKKAKKKEKKKKKREKSQVGSAFHPNFALCAFLKCKIVILAPIFVPRALPIFFKLLHVSTLTQRNEGSGDENGSPQDSFGQFSCNLLRKQS